MWAAWLTIWSKASSEKLMVISSTTGRRPVMAAPTPIPTIGFSETGASRAELVQQPRRHLERPVEDPDVLPHEHHRLVAAHLLAQRRVQRLSVAHHGHPSSSPRCTPGERSSIEYQPWTWSPST